LRAGRAAEVFPSPYNGATSLQTRSFPARRTTPLHDYPRSRVNRSSALLTIGLGLDEIDDPLDAELAVSASYPPLVADRETGNTVRWRDRGQLTLTAEIDRLVPPLSNAQSARCWREPHPARKRNERGAY
jgi:hypothetical protein